MLPAASKAGGSCLGVPDVCKTQVGPAQVPIPYPNTAMVCNAQKTCAKVQIENLDVVVETSEIPSSTGDQAGSIGGVVSGTAGQKVAFKLGSSKVQAQGKGIAFQSAMTSHNKDNMPAGLHESPSQAKVLVMP